MMDFKEVIRRGTANEPVYTVIGFLFRNYASEIRIEEIGTSYETVPVVVFTNPFTGEREEISIYELYPDFESATKAAMEMQKKYGHVIITQDQYDEYMDLKKKFGNNV